MHRTLRAVRTAAGSPWARLAGTAAGILMLIHTVDWGGAARSFGHVDAWLMVGAVGLTCLAVAASVVEWGVLLRTAPVTAG